MYQDCEGLMNEILVGKFRSMKFLFGNWLNDDLDVEIAWPMVDNERKSVLETNYLLLRLWAGPAGCHFGCSDRVADVGGARERRSTTGQGLLRQEGPPTYAILSRNSVLSRFTHFLKGFHRAPNGNHPAFLEHSTTAILLS